ncbi:response regulator [Phytohabitans sp. ZYX-F-186]|uniref:Response regulator n=1 Tax=Phytohabitans maris TaxID=3071409 RepID=A0ABU0ZTN6_9ACTN|nr:response regulator [Phytohabitans sp. ZYX-F-186]MDQ7909842.1 response regulator [Phytohabitans sp. ZYX-F-186]
MDHAASPHRVKLLGELQVFSAAGEAMTLPVDHVMQRLLVVMALRAGKPRRTDELIAAVWPGNNSINRDAKSLETPVSRLRGKLGMPIPPRRGNSFYRLDLARHQVDALEFVDVVRGDRLDLREIQRLLRMWRGDPRVIFGELPVAEWDGLSRAIGRFSEHLRRLSAADRRELGTSLETISDVLPEIADAALPPAISTLRRQRRLLIVEDEINVAKMLASILYDYHTTIAVSLEEAMQVLTEQLAEFDGALIDLHLTERRMDSAGLEVLSYIRDRRPDLPRLLITASPPSGSLEQLRRTYGIMDALIKGADGYSAAGVRDVVGFMFNESEEASRRRAKSKFESHAVQIQRDLMQRTIAARRGIRSERTSYTELDRCMARLVAFERDSEEMRQNLSAATITDLDRLISEFVARWPIGSESAGAA